jgi:acetoacetyl-CoA synthetase
MGANDKPFSDGTLNPSGIRFGSSEIYSVVESPHFTMQRGISNTLCVGRKRTGDRDEAVFLFIKMHPGHILTACLEAEIRDEIKKQLSPRHVPRFIRQVNEVPVTINGKKVEIAVKRLLSGAGEVKVSSTVANPEALEEYRKYRDLEEARKDAKL